MIYYFNIKDSDYHGELTSDQQKVYLNVTESLIN